jgi:hypothetical protein
VSALRELIAATGHIAPSIQAWQAGKLSKVFSFARSERITTKARRTDATRKFT